MRDTIKKQQIQQQNNAKANPQFNNRNQITKSSIPQPPAHPGGLAAGFPRGISPNIAAGVKPGQHILQKHMPDGKVVVASSGQPTPGMKTMLPAQHHGVAPGGKAIMKPSLANAQMANAKEKNRNTHYSSAVG